MINIETLTGTTVIYFRIQSDIEDIESTTLIYGVSDIGFTSENILNENSILVNGFWGEDYLYLNIYYVEDLTPSTKYYYLARIKKNDGTFEYSDIDYTYTYMKKTEAEIAYDGSASVDNITYGFWETDDATSDWKNTTYPNSTTKVPKILVEKDSEGNVTKATVLDENNEEKIWTSEYKLLESDAAFVLKCYLNAGYIPKCSFLVTFAASLVNSSAAYYSETNPARIGFYNITYCRKDAMLHELSHYMDNVYADGLSTSRYVSKQSFGYIMGSMMHKFCSFWFGYDTTGTASHSTHCYPFSSYPSSIETITYNGETIAIEDTDFMNLMHKSGAMFNVTKGYDGFIGISNQLLITPCYCVKDGSYKIYTSENTVLNNNLTRVSPDSENTVWNIQYYPLTGYYTIKIDNKYLTINDDSISLDTSENYILIAPSVYNISGEITNLLDTVSFIKRNIVTTDNYNLEFIIERPAIKQDLTVTTYNPRFLEFCFKLETIAQTSILQYEYNC